MFRYETTGLLLFSRGVGKLLYFVVVFLIERTKLIIFQHHCRHCGKVFCNDCVSKNVNSGPNLRPSKVCDVCHTILVQDATPYFSTEPPATPD